jgi:ABC-type transporter Mla subunit MlaD
MRNTQTKLAALLMALCLLVTMLAPAALAVEGDTLTISTVEELLTFAQQCSLDTWSQGKTVTLTADLDLTGVDFTPIPTFGGTFQGQGHRITGLRLTGSGSNLGLFRYLQSGAVVEELTVSGSVTPSGTKSTVGGIVGVNAGSVLNCVFAGTVKGTSNVGGIAGQNAASGQIAGCSVTGLVIGKTDTGGVAGRNSGVVLKCENKASVNTADPDTASVSDELSELGSIDPLELTDGENAVNLLNDSADTGGIAGYSSGVVQSCTNSGVVGYPHVGYNVGGIVGRQTGYLAGCSNSGTIYGRKDVGGIVGQAEPDVLLNPGKDTLNQLREELNTLKRLIDQALDHTDSNRAQISAQLSAIGSTADDAKDSSKQLIDHLTDFADENLDTINSLSVSVTAALDQLSDALDDLSDVADCLDTLSDQLSDALDTLGKAADAGEDTFRELDNATQHLGDAGDDLSYAVDEVRDALNALQKVIYVDTGYETQVSAAVGTLVTAIRDLGAALTEAGDAMDSLQTALSGGISDLLTNGQQAVEAVGAIRDALRSAGTALNTAGHSLNTITTYTHFSQAQLNAGLSLVSAAMADAEEAAEDLDDALDDLHDALQAGQTLSDQLGDALDQLDAATDTASALSNHLKSAFDTMGDAVDQLVEEGPFTFTPIDQEARDAGDDLYNSLSDLSGEFDDLLTMVDTTGDTLSADLRAISQQINKVFDLVLDALTDSQEAADGTLEDLIEDTSDEDIAATKQGKVTDCRNIGSIQGDRNVGGIIGSMSIEYDLDPEDEGTRISLGSTYETKAVLQSSVNRGSVTAKKDCAGGMVGNMDLGTAVDCQNYGSVSSTSGSYVGGIVGLSHTTVRDNYAKCTLSGTNYIGGIAGWGEHITNCAAIATIAEGTEYLGAIAGDADLTDGTLYGNVFVDTGIAGIDGISYTGIAQPVAYETMRQRESVPTEFVSFTLTLLTEEQQVAAIPFQYGEDLSLLDLPEVPQKEGYYGTWPEFDTSGLQSDLVLEAQYIPWVTLVASGEREGKLALALVDGQFTQDAVLHVTDSTVTPPEGEGQTDVWEITLEGADVAEGETLQLRLFNRGGGKASVWQYQNGRWKSVSSTTNGHYLLVTMTGSSGIFCVRAVQGNWMPLLLLLVGIVLAVAVIYGIIRLRERKRSKTKKAKR